MERSFSIVFYDAQGRVVDTRGCDPRNVNAINAFAENVARDNSNISTWEVLEEHEAVPDEDLEAYVPDEDWEAYCRYERRSQAEPPDPCHD